MIVPHILSPRSLFMQNSSKNLFCMKWLSQSRRFNVSAQTKGAAPAVNFHCFRDNPLMLII